MEAIGKIIATDKQPSTIEEFTFWTRKDLKLKPFDVVVVEHVKDVNGEPTKTFGVIEEISHMTDSPSALAGYISSDFGQVESTSYTERIGMNYVKCKVVGNTKNIYIPVQEGKKVYLAERDEIMEALGLNNVTSLYMTSFQVPSTSVVNFVQVCPSLDAKIHPLELLHTNLPLPNAIPYPISIPDGTAYLDQVVPLVDTPMYVLPLPIVTNLPLPYAMDNKL